MSRPRVLFALPGLHLVQRGAEVAFEQIASGLCAEGFEVTLLGAGAPIEGRPYRYLQGKVAPRERFHRWPKFPPLRSEYRWEELSFAPSVWRLTNPKDYDLTVTCSYPFVNWMLRARRKGGVPKHVFVTENGDWPATERRREYRWFSCDLLVCTNPEYEARNRERWRCALIPNGVLAERFTPGPGDKARFGIPAHAKVVCMVSALIASKYPLAGVEAVASLPEDVHLLLAGDGPLREECDALGRAKLGERYHRITVPMAEMPTVYRTGDVFMHLSRDEAFGNIYIEAQACGLPVVAHDTPTTRWILGEAGHFLDTGDAAALHHILVQLLDQPPAEAWINKARTEIVGRFDWPVVCRQYAGVFRELLDL